MEGNNHRNNVICECDTAQKEALDKGKPAAHPFFNAYLIPDGHFAEFRAKDKHALLAHDQQALWGIAHGNSMLGLDENQMVLEKFPCVADGSGRGGGSHSMMRRSTAKTPPTHYQHTWSNGGHTSMDNDAPTFVKDILQYHWRFFLFLPQSNDEIKAPT